MCCTLPFAGSNMAYKPNPATSYATNVSDGTIMVRGVRRTENNGADDVTVQAMDFGPENRDWMVEQCMIQVDHALDQIQMAKRLAKEEKHGKPPTA